MSVEVLRGGSFSVLCFSSPASSHAPRHALLRLSCQPTQPLYAPHVRIRSRSLFVQCSKREEPLFDRYELKRKTAINRKYLSSVLEHQYSVGLFGALAVVAGIQLLQSVFNPSSLEEQKARRKVSKQVERREDLVEETVAAEELNAQEDVSEEILPEAAVPDIVAPVSALSTEAMETAPSNAVTEQPQLESVPADVSREEEIDAISGNGVSTNGAVNTQKEELPEQIEDETKINEAILPEEVLNVEQQLQQETESEAIQDPVMEPGTESEEVYEDPQPTIPDEPIEEPIAVQDVMSNVDIPEVTHERKTEFPEPLTSSHSQSPSWTESPGVHERIPVVKESAINAPSFYRQSLKVTTDSDKNTAKESLNGVKSDSEDSRIPDSLAKKYGVYGLAKYKNSLIVFTTSVMFVYLLLRWIVGALYPRSTPTRKIIHNEVAQSVTVTRPSIYDLYEAVDDETEIESDGGGYTTEDREIADYAADDEDDATDKDDGWPFK